MYEHFYNLSAEPFRLSPDHRFCYNHAKYAKAKAYMAYAFMRAEGFVLITGEPGTGKTTLVGDLIETLADEHVAVGNLVSTQLAADDLLRMIAFAFGVDAEAAEKAVLLQHLTVHFLNLARTGGRALLIVDEAQDLTTQALEELRLLTNLQENGQPLLQIFLLGQPPLQTLVHTAGLEQMHQRIVAASQMEALGEDETRAYVEHRLQVVGWRNDPAISAAVYPIIYLFSDGVPRRINLICSRLFLHSSVEQRHQITVQDARTVVEELQEEQLSTRNILHHELFHAKDEFELVFLPEKEEAAHSVEIVEAGEQEASCEEVVEAATASLQSSGPAVNSSPTGATAQEQGEAPEQQLAPEILDALVPVQAEEVDGLSIAAANDPQGDTKPELAKPGDGESAQDREADASMLLKPQAAERSHRGRWMAIALGGLVLFGVAAAAMVPICKSSDSVVCSSLASLVARVQQVIR